MLFRHSISNSCFEWKSHPICKLIETNVGKQENETKVQKQLTRICATVKIHWHTNIHNCFLYTINCTQYTGQNPTYNTSFFQWFFYPQLPTFTIFTHRYYLSRFISIWTSEWPAFDRFPEKTNICLSKESILTVVTEKITIINYFWTWYPLLLVNVWFKH